MAGIPVRYIIHVDFDARTGYAEFHDAYELMDGQRTFLSLVYRGNLYRQGREQLHRSLREATGQALDVIQARVEEQP